MPKLYPGCFGIARDKTVHGPIPNITNNENFWIEERGWFRPNGTHFRLYEEMREWDILHVFPTREAALAYLSRLSLWRRVWARIKGTFDWRGAIVGVVIGWLLYGLFACSPGVVDPPCVQERPEVIGGGLEDSILVRDSVGGCQ